MGERSCSVVECLTRDRGGAGWSLTGVTALYPWARHIYPSLVLVQPRKTRPYITERLLMQGKESNKTNKVTIWASWGENLSFCMCTTKALIRLAIRGLIIAFVIHFAESMTAKLATDKILGTYSLKLSRMVLTCPGPKLWRQVSLNASQKYCRILHLSILQYFWHALQPCN